MEEKEDNNGNINTNHKIKKDKFKWFIAILIFLLIALLITVIGIKPKNVFDSCYDKCTSQSKEGFWCLRFCKGSN